MLRGDNRRDSRPSRHVQCCHSHSENSRGAQNGIRGRCFVGVTETERPKSGNSKVAFLPPPLPSPSETRQLRQTSVIRSVSANGRSDDADVRAIDLRVSDLISLSHRAPALGCAPLEDDHEPLVAPEAAWPTTPNTTPIATGVCPASVRVVLGACPASVRVGCVPI